MKKYYVSELRGRLVLDGAGLKLDCRGEVRIFNCVVVKARISRSPASVIIE